MSLTIKYAGVDITSKADVYQCIHDMYAEKRADTLMLKFNDSGLWDGWGAAAGDEIEVSDGNIRSGKMYVRRLEPMTGYYVLRASSLPTGSDAEHSQSWERITKLELAKDFANRHDLLLKTYGITDRKFMYLQQSGESDFDFLEKLCVLEGDAFLIYDGSLILYNEEYIESLGSSRTLKITGDNLFHYEEELEYSGCTVMNESMTYSYLKTSDYGYVAERTISQYIASEGDAERYAKNLLKYLNKEKKSGYFYVSPISEDYAAGTVVSLKTADTASYDGLAMLTHVRHDYESGKSKIFFRKI